jgi:hypothetical protein
LGYSRRAPSGKVRATMAVLLWLTPTNERG